MKHLLLRVTALAAFGVMSVMSVAFANEDDAIKATCQFRDKNTVCHASVLYCDLPEYSSAGERERCESEFRVSCNGDKIFKGDFKTRVNEDYVVVKAKDRGGWDFPVLKYGTPDDLPDTVWAKLWLGKDDHQDDDQDDHQDDHQDDDQQDDGQHGILGGRPDDDHQDSKNGALEGRCHIQRVGYDLN